MEGLPIATRQAAHLVIKAPQGQVHHSQAIPSWQR